MIEYVLKYFYLLKYNYYYSCPPCLANKRCHLHPLFTLGHPWVYNQKKLNSYIKGRKEASKEKTKRMKKSKLKEIVLEVLNEKSIHDPVKPGILKKRLGKLSCSKVRSAKSKLKNKGTHYAKALQRYLNYHC